MTRRDLVVLAADKDLEHALRGLLSRHKSLPIRQIVFDIFVHPEHDAACARRGVSFLSPLSQRYRYALLIMDHEGSGREKISADDLQEALNQEFRVSAWGERGKAIVLDPELEIWVWSDSPHVDAVAGWADRRPRLRQWLNDHGLWDDQDRNHGGQRRRFMPPCMRRVWRAAHRSTNSSPNEYPSTGAAIVPFMTCAPFCASGFQDNGRKVHEHRPQAPRGSEGLRRGVVGRGSHALVSTKAPQLGDQNAGKQRRQARAVWTRRRPPN